MWSEAIMGQPHIPDIVAFLQSAEKWVGDELELGGLEAGDRLLVHTRNTRYLFLMEGKDRARLTSDRSDRPSGTVRIQGCVFGRSRMIKPNHLFCGGAMEIVIEEGRRKFTTTPIATIQLIKTDRNAGGGERPRSAAPA
jgi:hypothetical protein